MKRFWKVVDLARAGDGWQVTLDGRPIKTQGGRPQRVPSQALAGALANEWRAQGEELDASAFPLRDLTDFAIDRIASGRDDIVSRTLAFGETDTLCYRAAAGEALARRQDEEWEPLLTAFEAREGVSLERIAGVVHAPQPAGTMATLRARLDSLDPLTLAGVHTLSSLAASLCIGLSALEPGTDADGLWNAANLEEDVQAELWGQDAEAAEIRAARRENFLSAYRFLELLRA